MEDKQPSVFVGSSVEGLSLAEAVQVALDYACEVTIWSQGVFGLGEGTLEALVNRLDDFDFAILVLTADDLTFSRGSRRQSPRDNVLLELGLFIGRLGRGRTFAMYDRNSGIELPSDLAGVTMADYRLHSSGDIQSSIGAACTLIKRAIESRGRRTDQVPASFGLAPPQQQLEGPVAANSVGNTADGLEHVPAAGIQNEYNGDSEEAGFLEKLADMEEGVSELASACEEFNEVMGELRKPAEIRAKQIERIKNTGGSAGAKVPIANRLAEEFVGPTKRLEHNVAAIKDSVEKTDPGVRFILGQIRAGKEVEGGGVFSETVKKTAQIFLGVLVAVESARAAILDSGEATRSLRKINGRIAQSFDEYSRQARRVVDWGSLLDDNG